MENKIPLDIKFSVIYDESIEDLEEMEYPQKTSTNSHNQSK